MQTPGRQDKGDVPGSAVFSPSTGCSPCPTLLLCSPTHTKCALKLCHNSLWKFNSPNAKGFCLTVAAWRAVFQPKAAVGCSWGSRGCAGLAPSSCAGTRTRQQNSPTQRQDTQTLVQEQWQPRHMAGSISHCPCQGNQERESWDSSLFLRALGFSRGASPQRWMQRTSRPPCR